MSVKFRSNDCLCMCVWASRVLSSSNSISSADKHFCRRADRQEGTRKRRSVCVCVNTQAGIQTHKDIGIKVSVYTALSPFPLWSGFTWEPDQIRHLKKEMNTFVRAKITPRIQQPAPSTNNQGNERRSAWAAATLACTSDGFRVKICSRWCVCLRIRGQPRGEWYNQLVTELAKAGYPLWQAAPSVWHRKYGADTRDHRREKAVGTRRCTNIQEVEICSTAIDGNSLTPQWCDLATHGKKYLHHLQPKWSDRNPVFIVPVLSDQKSMSAASAADVCAAASS